jgi:uncharacterized membrane protein YsdA (DUF1294 family)
MGTENTIIDGIFKAIVNVISTVLTWIVSVVFVNKYIAIITYFVLVNLLAIFLMKKDKKLAKTPDARRIRERTLLVVALAGGGLGEYYAMYKYKHKTLHQKFLVIVPISILLHFLVLSYTLLVGISA